MVVSVSLGYHFIKNGKPLKDFTVGMMWTRTVVRPWYVGWLGEGKDEIRSGIWQLMRLGVGRIRRGSRLQDEAKTPDVVSLIIGRKVLYQLQKVFCKRKGWSEKNTC